MNSTHAHCQFILSNGFGPCKATPNKWCFMIYMAAISCQFGYPQTLSDNRTSAQLHSESTATRINLPTFPYQNFSVVSLVYHHLQGIRSNTNPRAFFCHRRWISRYFMCNYLYVSSDHIEFCCISTDFLIIFGNVRTPHSSSQYSASTAQLCARKYSGILICLQILWNVCLRCPRINWESFSMCRERTLKRITWIIQKQNVSQKHFDSFAEQFWGFCLE